VSDNKTTTLLESPPGQVKGSQAKGPAASAKKAEVSTADWFFTRLIGFFSSLRLTVVCLFLGMILVFWGTLAQVDLGLFKAQNEFFRSFLIYWGPKGATWKIPIFPGGYLVGGLLLINLVTAHFTRFKWTRKKIGIWMVHVGVILLLVGQLLTDVLSHESHMWLTEGQAKNYSDSSSHEELAVVDTTSPNYDDVVAFPGSMVVRKDELRNEKLPFTIRVKDYFANSDPRIRAPMVDNSGPQTTQGIGQRLTFLNAPPTVAMDSRNIPAAVVEVLTAEGSLGTWVVSNWLVEEKLVQILQTGFRNQLGDTTACDQLAAALVQPQQFSYRGHTYQLALRPERFYKPFSIELQKFSHDIYRGTDIPKNFSSRVRLQRTDTGEDREVLIYMNNPLRYAGETFYQSGFDDVDPRVTILQVVHNPGWLTPYFSCILVAAGLLVQFLTHLIGFITKRKTT
jgi:hypothetical protein